MLTTTTPLMPLTPRHYQIDGIEYLTTPNVFQSKTAYEEASQPNTMGPLFASLISSKPTLCRHILSDAPGAGKTPQSIWASLELLKQADATTPSTKHSVMILAPAHLAKQWFDYMCEHWPEYHTVWLEGSKAQRTKEANYKATFYIMSVQSLRQQHYMDLLLSLYEQQHVLVTIVDESHYVKNPDAVTSHNVQKLTKPEQCPHVILLTATPIVREANDLYWQLHIVDPFVFHRYDIFLNKYCWFNYGSWGYTDVMLHKGASDSLKQWLWGRSYLDIGLELPPLIDYVHPIPLSAARSKAYNDMRNYWYIQLKEEGVSANSSMEAMHMLRHITACPEKAQPLTEYMQDDPGPYLVACFYRASASFLASAIKAANPTFEVTVITGETPADLRRELAIKSSQTKTSVIVATIPSISEGVDLSHCNTVYFFEEDWTPGKHYQFLSRVRRHRENSAGLGVTITEDNHLLVDQDPNDRPIIVRYFHADRTIDQRIHAVRDNRAANAKDIIKLELAL